jgi:hypothetical protein
MAKMKKDQQLSLLLPINARTPAKSALQKPSVVELRVGPSPVDRDARDTLVFELKKSGLLALKKG